MYEIWLVLNIVWELALDVWPWLVAVATLWLVLVAAAARMRGVPAVAGLAPAVGVGALVAALAVFLVPAMVKSSVSEVAYWVDWANLAAIAGGLGAVAVAFAWPLLHLRAGRRVATGT
jgi:hypothetical protein